MRTGLILVAIVFATGVTAAVAVDAMQPGASPTPRVVPPVPPGATAPIKPPGAYQLVPAPIDGLEIRIRGSAPPQHALYVLAGLPSGCAQKHSHSVTQTGDVFVVQVLNSMPPGNPVCTAIYGSYELTIELRGDIRPGLTYTVKVNDKHTTFVGQ